MKEHSGVGVAVEGEGVGVAGEGVGVAGDGVFVGVTGTVGVVEHSEGNTRTPLKHFVPRDTFIMSDHCPFPHIAK